MTKLNKREEFLVLFGTDSLANPRIWNIHDGNPRVSTTIFEENIKKIVDTKIKHNLSSPTIFVGIMPTTKKYLERQPNQNKLISEWNNIIKDNLTKNCYYVDVEEFFYENEALQESMVHPDGHHLNIAGHEIYANLILDVIKTIP